MSLVKVCELGWADGFTENIFTFLVIGHWFVKLKKTLRVGKGVENEGADQFYRQWCVTCASRLYSVYWPWEGEMTMTADLHLISP